MQLSPQQIQIVEHDAASSALVVASAGSGKTTVIAQRAIRIADRLPVGTKLQMLTFSNKAAKEMRERVKLLSNGRDVSDSIVFDTFHSLGMRLIRDDPTGFNLTANFALLNETDTKRSIRLWAKKHGLPKDLDKEDRKRLNPMSWLNTWSLARQAGYDVSNSKNYQVLGQRLAKAHKLSPDETTMALSTLLSYEVEKKQSGVVDFDDLLYSPLLRVARDEAYRSTIQQYIGHVMVDEYQDTNRIQYEMLRRLALGHCGVTCVGDDDQSIYGWRGAEVSNLKRFIAQFNAKQLHLEQNYRSTQSIVNAASRLISVNQERLSKNPFSQGDMGEVPDCQCYDDSFAMADGIAQSISKSLAEGTRPADIAVLYRTNRMAMIVEQGLRRMKIPYHVVGGMSLFDRAEVVGVTSALRLSTNPRDMFALKAITPYVDGFGAASGYLVSEWLEADPQRSLNNLPDQVPGVTEQRLKVLKDFMAVLGLEAWCAQNPAEFVEWVVDGPMRLLEREKDAQLKASREQYLKAFAQDITQEHRDRLNGEPDLTWRDVMLEVSLRDARQTESPDGVVTLSTIHRSKGLEWDQVLIAGMSEGLMPLDPRQESNNDDDLGYSHHEEERRLAFVGVTRAKRMCRVFHADRYAFPGGQEDREFQLSSFAGELGLSPVYAIDSKAPSSSNDLSELAEGDGFDFDDFTKQFKGIAPRGM